MMVKAIFSDTGGTLLSFKTHTVIRSAIDAIRHFGLIQYIEHI